MLRRTLSWIGLLVLPFGVLAQQARFSASIDAKQVLVGSTFSVEFMVENSDADNFQAPNFNPFKVVSGPSQSFRSTFINGVGTRSVSFSYTLQATRVGKFTIPAATVIVKGKTMRSNPVTLEVLKGEDIAKTGAGASPQIFIQAEVDSNRVYIGQQVMIRYKIYTQVNIENYNILTEASYAGCFAQALDTYKEPVLKQVIQGKEYSTKVLRKVAIFPQQGGKIEIEPLVVQVGVPSSSSVRRGLLSSFGLERKNINSNSITLNVTSPHDHSPGDFSGAVGHFTVDYALRPNQATTDDAISITLRIRGNGDVKTIRAPELVLPSGFEVFDPKIKEEKMINATDSVRGDKIIEYLVIGHRPGQYQIKPSFTYFDPSTGTYSTVVDSFPVLITQGSGALSATGDNTLKQEDDELHPIIHNLDLHKIRKPLYQRPWYIGTFIVPLLAFLFVSWRAKRSVTQEVQVDPHAVARERLQKAKQYMDEASHKQFYEEIAYSLKEFISYKLNIPMADLSKQKITEVLRNNSVQESVIEQTIELLNRCDYALYAGIHDHTKVQNTYTDALEILTGLHHAEVG
ncbi:MAG: protein BatD [Saprospiraceae bacterium]|nr:protein BatD [Saprospiraceae bacterium]